MSWHYAARTRLRLLFSGHHVESRMDEEMSFHVQMEADRLVREHGLNPDEARRQAQLSFGGADKYKEEMRDGRGLAWLSGLRLDVKLGIRMLIKYPGLTFAGVLAIAVAVGLAASWHEFTGDMFSPKLPLDEDDRIVVLRNWDTEAGGQEQRSLHDFETWRAEAESLQDLMAGTPSDYAVSTQDRRIATLSGIRMTASGFRLARVAPLLGRPLTDADEAPDAPAVVVLSHSAWQTLFDGDPSAVGSTVRVGADVATVVGVMPEGFGFPVNEELWTPLRERAITYERREGPPIMMMARLSPGYTLEQAQTELNTIGQRTAAAHPQTHEHLQPRVLTMGDALTGDMGAFVAMVNVPFILFLVVVCANVATLVFARTATREGELAVRSALGASRRRLVLQLFAEALLLTSAGAALGLTAAHYGLHWGMDLFWEVQQSRPPFWSQPGLSASTVVYAALLAVFAAAIIGGLPALKATGRRLRNRLAQPGTGGSGMRFGAISTGVIIVQVALCVGFMPIAIMNGRAMLPEESGETAFPADEFLSARLVRQTTEAASEAEREAARTRNTATVAELQRRVEAEPGVIAVTFASRMPGFNHPVEPIQLERDSVHLGQIRLAGVDHRFFDVMGARITNGRGFRVEELAADAPIVVVDEGWAQENLPGVSPVGQRIRFTGRAADEANEWHEIVGTVAGLEQALGPSSSVAVYAPLQPGAQASTQFYVRTTERPEVLVPQIHDMMAAVDPELGLLDVMPLDEAWSPVYRSNVFFVMALVTVAGIILSFALIGIYALMSFTVSQRAREIGIRAALGANPRRIVISIFSRAFLQISLGVAAGGILVGATIMNTPSEVSLVGGVAALMMVFGMIGCIIPAMRALRIQPTDALKAE